ncbi:MAG: prohibitin family protein [Defluviitaleaceae bacterium]|nr:prohibitin family protein [Defluviitaleaceae bacterium]
MRPEEPVVVDFKKGKGASGMKKAGFGIALFITAVILALVIVLPSFRVVRTEEAAVVRRWGVVDRTLPPGINFVFWIPNTVDYFDLQVREQAFRFSAYSVDAQNVSGYVTVLYRINQEDAMLIAEQFGSVDQLERRMDGVLLQEIQNVFALKSAMEIVEQRAVISHEIHDRLRAVTNQFHITVTMVSVESIDFSRAFELAVEQRMIAEQDMMQAEFERERALIIANQQLEVQTLEAEAVVVRARAEAESIVLQAEAEAEALRVMRTMWQGMPEEMRDVMLRQMFFDTWDGGLPHVWGQDNLGIIMDGLQ